MLQVYSICPPEEAAQAQAKLIAEPFFIGGRQVIVAEIVPVPADPEGLVRVNIGLAAPRVKMTRVVARMEPGQV